MATSPTAVFEHSYYIGNYMSGILYGVELCLYFTTLRALLSRHTSERGRDRFFIIYTTILLLLLTIDISTNAVWGENMWITDRDNEGGVGAFLAKNINVWYQTLSSTTVVTMIFMGDALLIWRLFVIFGSNYWVIILPIMMYITAFVLAIIELVAAGVPNGNFFKGTAVNVGVPYYALTISMNILVTLLICVRLFFLSSKVRSALGEDSARLYTGVAAMLIESAAPYTLVGIMFLVPYARGSDTAISFGQVWAKLTCISPQLIVLRVASGRAWRRDTMSRLTTGSPSIAFASTQEPKTSRSDGPYTISHGTTLRDGSHNGGSVKSVVEV